ncbi:MAG: hypothetical protein NTNFB02_03470 [Nitrospira sp.]
MLPDSGNPETDAANGLAVPAGTTVALFGGGDAAAIGKGLEMVREEEIACAEVTLGAEVSVLVGGARVESACGESGTDLEAGV